MIEVDPRTLLLCLGAFCFALVAAWLIAIHVWPFNA